LTWDGRNEAMALITDYYNTTCETSYYMLLNHKKSYYTVFHISNEGDCNFFDFADAVISCATDLGEIYSVSRTEDNQAIEIWVCDEDDIMHCLYLFNYDRGIVKVKK
jgi:dTDP-4-dehydrorhamnose reductase